MRKKILFLIILCNYDGKYKLPIYFIIIIFQASIIDLIIFLKPRLWAFSCCKPSPSPIQAQQWAGLGQAQMGWAWALGFGPSPAHHYMADHSGFKFIAYVLTILWHI
jgi:hypothetical protein